MFRVQGLEADAFVFPGAVGLVRLTARVALDRVAIVSAASEFLDQHQLALPRTGAELPEQADAAVRDARLHRRADDLGDESIVFAPQRRAELFVSLGLDLGVVEKTAGRSPKTPARNVGHAGPHGGLDMLGVETVEGAIEIPDQDRFAAGDADRVRKRVLQPDEQAFGAHLGGLGLQVILERLEQFGVLARDLVEIAPQPEVKPVRSGILKEHADRGQTFARKLGFKEHVAALVNGSGSIAFAAASRMASAFSIAALWAGSAKSVSGSLRKGPNMRLSFALRIKTASIALAVHRTYR